MSSFVRDSKFRHTVVSVSRRESHYEQLKISNAASDGNGITANSKFLAYIESGGSGSAIGVLPLASTGKTHVPITAPTYQQPLIRAHGQPVQDLSFNPFNKNQLYSCSTDNLIKVWDIPSDGYIVDESTPTATLKSGDSLPIRGIFPHPSVESILAARGSRDVFLFDLSTGTHIASSPAGTYTADLQSSCWSFLGDVLATTGKDKKLRLLDLRRSPDSVIAETNCHSGTRGSRCVWLGDSPFLLTCGHSSLQERELLLWDSRNLSSHVKRERIDTSTGSLMPFFDADTGLLVLAGKGDSAVRLFEIGGEGSEINAISNTPVGSDIIRGACLMPKQANDSSACEVLRVLKLTDNCVQPVTFTVPRKEKSKFHSDLFPPSVWEAPPSMTAAAWLEGANTPPNRIEISAIGGSAAGTPRRSSLDSAVGGAAVSAVGGAKEDICEADSIAAEAATLASKRASMNLGSTLKFRHMYGTESPKHQTFFNLRPATSMTDSPLITASDLYWAVPYQGAGGGPVYVSRLDKFGKVEPECPLINGHKSAVSDLAFSPFHNGLLATASGDATIKLWQLPEDGETTASSPLPSMTEADASLTIASNRHSVRTVDFHPVVQGLLASTAQDNTIKLFDVNAGGCELTSVTLPIGEGAMTANVSFNLNGGLISVACKDRVVRIVDPRSRAIVMATPDSSSSGVLGRNLRAVWASTQSADTLFTVCSASSGLRTVHLWDPRSMDQPICSRSIDNAAGQLFPMYDEGTGLVFVAGKGDTIIRYYEMSFLREITISKTAEKSNEFQSSRDPIAGICLLSKRVCDIRNVEASRVLKLTIDSVVPISFTVPRAEHLKQYYHDDLFLPVRRRSDPPIDVGSWMDAAPSSGTGDSSSGDSLFSPTFESLQPEGMPKLSEKPVAEPVKLKTSSFREAIDKREQEAKLREEAFNKLASMAISRAVYHPNNSGGGHGFKVDAKPQHDDDSDEADWDD